MRSTSLSRRWPASTPTPDGKEGHPRILQTWPAKWRGRTRSGRLHRLEIRRRWHRAPASSYPGLPGLSRPCRATAWRDASSSRLPLSGFYARLCHKPRSASLLQISSVRAVLDRSSAAMFPPRLHGQLMVGVGHLPGAVARVAALPLVGAVTGCTCALAEHANRLPKHGVLCEVGLFLHRSPLYLDGCEASGNATRPSLPSRRLLPPCCWPFGLCAAACSWPHGFCAGAVLCWVDAGG